MESPASRPDTQARSRVSVGILAGCGSWRLGRCLFLLSVVSRLPLRHDLIEQRAFVEESPIGFIPTADRRGNVEELDRRELIGVLLARIAGVGAVKILGNRFLGL